jgi:hypothetical protein
MDGADTFAASGASGPRTRTSESPAGAAATFVDGATTAPNATEVKHAAATRFQRNARAGSRTRAKAVLWICLPCRTFIVAALS